MTGDVPRFRVGRKVGRTIYLMVGDEPSDDDRLVGVMDDKHLSEQAVHGLNAWPDIAAADVETEHYPAEGQTPDQQPRGVKITHKPTGLWTSSDTERSRLANTSVCMHELRYALAVGGDTVTPTIATDPPPTPPTPTSHADTAWVGVLDVFVPGAAAPQGSKRHVGRGVMVESSKAVKPWREDVRAACLAAWRDTTGPLPPIDGPVRLVIDFVRKRPASAPKRSTPPASTMPDLSKLIRSTEDAITSAGVWVDDARVVTIHAHKRLAEIGETPGARIRVEVPA